MRIGRKVYIQTEQSPPSRFLVNLISKIWLLFSWLVPSIIKSRVTDFNRSLVFLLQLQCKSRSGLKLTEKSFNWLRSMAFRINLDFPIDFMLNWIRRIFPLYWSVSWYEDDINNVAAIFKRQTFCEKKTEPEVYPWWPITDLADKICPIKDVAVKLSLGHALHQSAILCQPFVFVYRHHCGEAVLVVLRTCRDCTSFRRA